jgi:hypothetical protein
MVDMSVLNAEAARFEVGEHGFNAPAPAVFQGLQIARRGGQGDDPGSGVTRILDDANIGPRPLAGQFDILQREDRPADWRESGRSTASACPCGRLPAAAPPPDPSGWPRVQHRRHQQRQLAALRLALFGKELLKLGLDTIRKAFETGHRACPGSTKGGALESHTGSPCQQPFIPNRWMGSRELHITLRF